MKNWRGHLRWAVLPFAMQLAVFGFLCAINWGYESRMISVRVGDLNWTDSHLGPILMMIAVTLAVLAGITLLIASLCRPARNSGFYLIICLTLVAVFFVFPSLFIIVLGPAAITMKEQMIAAPRR